MLPSDGDSSSEKVSRRINTISVTHDLLQYGTSMFTSPVGFSDQQEVVLQFIGVGLGGPQSSGGKFPADALHHEPTVEWISSELESINLQGVQGLEASTRAQSMLREAALRYYCESPPHTPEYLRLRSLLARSSSEYVPLVAFDLLRQRGVCPLTMREAYVELVKLVCAHKGVEQLERQYQRVRQVLQTPENIH